MRTIRIVKSSDSIFEASWFHAALDFFGGKEIIWVTFKNEKALIRMLREHFFAQWSSTEKKWYVADTKQNREKLQLPEKLIGKRSLDKISEINQKELMKYQNYLVLQGLSNNTIRTYLAEFAQLLYEIKDFPVYHLTASKLQSYFLFCTKEKGLSENQIHSRMNAIKYYFEKVLHQQKMFFDIPRPKKHLQLPKYFNVREIKKMFSSVDNPKHLVMLKLCYGLGLRVSEIVHLKIEDIDSGSMKVLVQRGKGKKDRYVNLPHSILEELRDYYRNYMPKVYLFEGKTPGEPLNIRTAQMVFRNALLKANVKKKIGIHGLRHSYATHLLELGTDISLIQKLLGHENISTTLTYTQVTDPIVNNVISPLDRI